MSGRPSRKSAEIGLFRPFSAFFALFRKARRAPGKSGKRRKKAFFLRFPWICLNPHLLNPHLRHSKIRANHSQLKPLYLFIAGQADSHESLEVPIHANHQESCESIRANHATKSAKNHCKTSDFEASPPKFRGHPPNSGGMGFRDLISNPFFPFAHKKTTELIPKQFRFGNPLPTKTTEYNSQSNSVKDLVILCSHYLPRPTNSRNKSPRTPPHKKRYR